MENELELDDLQLYSKKYFPKEHEYQYQNQNHKFFIGMKVKESSNLQKWKKLHTDPSNHDNKNKVILQCKNCLTYIIITPRDTKIHKYCALDCPSCLKKICLGCGRVIFQQENIRIQCFTYKINQIKKNGALFYLNKEKFPKYNFIFFTIFYFVFPSFPIGYLMEYLILGNHLKNYNQKDIDLLRLKNGNSFEYDNNYISKIMYKISIVGFLLFNNILNFCYFICFYFFFVFANIILCLLASIVNFKALFIVIGIYTEMFRQAFGKIDFDES